VRRVDDLNREIDVLAGTSQIPMRGNPAPIAKTDQAI
jgi:hypothetical protein